MAKLVGTAGHVDHGKTTLVRALTGIETDRLAEEKRRGLSIELGFAYLDLPELGRVSIVDVPGHERFLTTMLAGATAMNVALLCVAADEGVKPQTVEHCRILDLLPVAQVLAVITRSDLADPGRATAETRDLLSETRFSDAPILPVSAQTGSGLDDLRATLSRVLIASLDPPPGATWCLPIDRVFTLKGFGTVVTGSLLGGSVRTGEPVAILPGDRVSRVRSIQVHGEAVSESGLGMRTALNLAGVARADLRRGQIVAPPGAVVSSDRVAAEVRWLSEVKPGQRVRVAIGTDEVIARLGPTRESQTLLRLERKTALTHGMPLIVRNYSPQTLLGGGRVLTAIAPDRRKPQSQMEASNEPIIRAIGTDPFGMPTEEVCYQLGVSAQALGDEFERLLRSGRILGFAGLWFTPKAFDVGVERFMVALDEIHRAQPNKVSVPKDLVSRASGLGWSGKPLSRILARLEEDGRLIRHADTIRATQFQVTLPPRQRALLDRVIAAIEAVPVDVPSSRQLADELGVPEQAVVEIAGVGRLAGELVEVGAGIWYTPPQLQAIAVNLGKLMGKRRFSLGDARDALATSRRYIVPILEYLDSQRITLRQTEHRVFRDSTQGHS